MISCTRPIARSGKINGQIMGNGTLVSRHDENPIAEIHRLLGIMGDHDHRLRLFLPQSLELFLEVLPHLVINRTEGFVHEQNFWITGQSANHRRALFHAAGDLTGIEVFGPVQLRQVEELLQPFLLLLFADFLLLHGEKDIFFDRHPGKEGKVLKNEAAVRAWLFNYVAVQQHGSTARLLKSGDNGQQGSFAAPRGSEQADKLPTVDIDADVLENSFGVAVTAVGFADFLKMQVHKRDQPTNRQRVIIRSRKRMPRSIIYPTSAAIIIRAISRGVSISVCASIIEKPNPALVAINSAQITLIHPELRPMRKPVMISGKAPGRVIREKMANRPAPIERAAW